MSYPVLDKIASGRFQFPFKFVYFHGKDIQMLITSQESLDFFLNKGFYVENANKNNATKVKYVFLKHKTFVENIFIILRINKLFCLKNV